MALVSISEAIKLSGVSRGTFYRKYLNEGLISTTQNPTGKKQIDTAELLRVFGKLSADIKTVSNETEQTERTNEVEQLRKQLQETKDSEQRLRDEFLDRENWYRQQIEKQDDKIKLLEHHHLEQLTMPKWWQFWK